MLRKLIKAKLCIMFSLALVVLLVPIFSVRAAINPAIGQSCDGKTKLCPEIACGDNAATTYTRYDGVQCASTADIKKIVLSCADSKCVVPPEWRAIGTWCDTSVNQCAAETAGFNFTCNTDAKICVANIAGMGCTADMARGNKDDKIGTLLTDISESDRCSIGLVCDSGDTGKCQNDFGQGKVPSDKLGETAEDIRDQIRNVINIALGFLGVAGVIVTIYGGALWMSAAGDDEKVGKAKKTIVSGLIGLVIIGIAWTIVSYVLTITQDIA